MKSAQPISAPPFPTPADAGSNVPASRFIVSEEPTKPRDFTALYRATVVPLRRYLARMLGNTAEAQDVAHDAYVRVYPTMMKAQPEKPEALLYVTARRLAINRLKRRSISPFSQEAANMDLASSCAPGVAQQVMARQELRLLEQAIAELPPGCRAVLLLRKIESLSHREIADRLGIAVSTVEKQYARALRLLRAALPQETEPSLPAAASEKEIES
ncbi:MAG TPA: sigma-70 family RNA polymerase sigma factor [Opitutaceae bacterium]|nr:sigma-70 family RNA polymerase sigma factor [Opitutaceae bacterium]